MALKQALMRWLHDYPDIFVAGDIPHGIALTERCSGKYREILYPEITQWRRKSHPGGEADYFNLVGAEARELVLCHAGFAFAPSFASIGEAVPLPDVVCFQDYVRFFTHLQHLYQDASQKTESIRTLLSCLAILEGAKLVGLEVSAEEAALEPILNWLETH